MMCLPCASGTHGNRLSPSTGGKERAKPKKKQAFA
jgi:hypothetical protein